VASFNGAVASSTTVIDVGRKQGELIAAMLQRSRGLIDPVTVIPNAIEVDLVWLQRSRGLIDHDDCSRTIDEIDNIDCPMG